MGFTEGFASGYGLVDAALQRRQTNALAAQELEQNRSDKVEERALKEREYGLKEAANRSDEAYKKGIIEHYQTDATLKNEQFNKTYGLQQDQLKALSEHQKASLGLQRDQLAAQAKTAAAQIAASNATREKASFELEQKKRETERLDAATEFQNNYLFQDPSTGGPVINVAPGQEERFADLAQRGLGADVVAMGKNLPEYQESANIMRSVAMNPLQASGNSPAVIKAVNLFAGHDLKQGVGEVDKDGNTITNKEAAGIMFHPDEKDPTNIDKGYYTVALKVSGETKDGKPFSRVAPMTQYRSSDSANDPNVRTFSHADVVRWVDGNGALVSILSANQQFATHIADSVLRARGEKKKTDPVIKVSDPVMDDTGYVVGHKDYIYNPNNNTATDPLDKLPKNGSKDESILGKFMKVVPK